jgi:hypothetical protein
MNRGRALRDLCAGLQGRLGSDVDWMGLLETANQALVTPALHSALQASGQLDKAPSDARAFMTEVAARNAQRNVRLRQMVLDAATALNTAGIEPTLLKGMAVWASRPDRSTFPRMMSDVDLLVAPAEVIPAVEALRSAGFGLLASYDGPSVHVTAELGRPDDVGLIDLHQRAPGPPGMAELFDKAAHASLAAWDARVWVPSPTLQIFLLCLHDQLHDGDYWRGGFDLRHLLDIAELTRAPGGVDWRALDAMIPTRLLRNAIHAQLIAAHRLTGAEIPEALLGRVPPRLQHRRHMAQHRHPRFGLLLAGLGFLLEGPNLLQHRALNRASRRDLLGSNAAEQHVRGSRAARLKQIMTLGAGKI